MPDAPAGLVERIRACLAPRSEIAEAYLFGSAARGEAQPHSDVDVAVFLEPPHPARSPYGYEADLAAELMRALSTSDVDVVVLNRAGPVLYHAVLRDGVRVLSRDPRATTRREGHALSRYCDYVPQLRKIDAALSARIARGDFGR
jgi:predicted nucleotidyltransferase